MDGNDGRPSRERVRLQQRVQVEVDRTRSSSRDRPRNRAAAATGVLEAVCRVAVAEFDLLGAVVAFPPRASAHVVAAASHAAARDLEELQFDTAEGPTLEACRLRFPVLVPHLDSSALGRWPGFVQAARAAGVHAVFALPLTIGASLFGALSMYRTAPGPLPQPGLRAALALGDIAVGTLIDAHVGSRAEVASYAEPGSPDPDGQEDDGFVTALSREALDGQSHVYQAQGMVMAQLQVSLTEALARMRAHAFTHGLSLSALSAAIVAGLVTLDDTDLP